MTTSRVFVVLFVIIAILIGGYYGYEYLKERPPGFLIKLLTSTKPPPPLPAGDLAPLTAPEGFTATIFSRDVPGARVMTRDPKGALLVSLSASGRIVALPNLDGDGKADKTVTVLEGLKQPHGLYVDCPLIIDSASATQDACVLYVAETDALKAYSYDADTYTAKYQKTLTSLPSGAGHFTRTLLMAPDNKHLLVSIGSSCNVCEESEPMRASIISVDLASDVASIFATGLRNSVFMAMHPVTGDIWATDNGRDVIGDDIPPDEINIIREGGWYGWPWFYGKNIEDLDFSPGSRPSFAKEPTPSHIDIQAHSAALGLAFVPEEGWPEEYWHDALVAYHGSWNRSVPTGYKVVRFQLDARGNPIQADPVDFLTGFMPQGGNEDSAIGRPVGLLAEPGGTVYVSDDRAGAIYRVSRNSLE